MKPNTKRVIALIGLTIGASTIPIVNNIFSKSGKPIALLTEKELKEDSKPWTKFNYHRE